jgi:outer membrane receptor for ferrienterochelin and colicins
MSDKLKIYSRLYITGYEDNASVFLQKDNSLYDRSFLHQSLLTPEVQVEYGSKLNRKLIAGTGYNYETIDADRYASAHQLNTFYGFVQKEWVLLNKLNITAGARLDKHSLYAAQFNPKLAMAYKATPRLSFTGSIGTGYKTPDFRQQFLNFTNSLVGYTILGADELSNGLLRMKQNGQLDTNSNINPYLNSKSLIGVSGVQNNALATTGVNGNTISASGSPSYYAGQGFAAIGSFKVGF